MHAAFAVASREWSWPRAALLLLAVFVARTWPARLAASTPQLEGVPYLGGLLRVAREVRRFPDFLVETSARFGILRGVGGEFARPELV